MSTNGSHDHARSTNLDDGDVRVNICEFSLSLSVSLVICVNHFIIGLIVRMVAMRIIVGYICLYASSTNACVVALLISSYLIVCHGTCIALLNLFLQCYLF